MKAEAEKIDSDRQNDGSLGEVRMIYKVSVIVPGYNVSSYIRQCLDSLVRQSLQPIQVIMIDDGSTDGETGRMMDEYAAAHKNFETIHQENRGLGAARNRGLRAAHGEYLAFVDSDDYVDGRAYEKMYAMAKQTDSDIISGGVNRFKSNVNRKSFLHRKAIADTCKRTHITERPELLYDTTAWNKLYKKSFWDRCGLSFPEHMLYEDIPVTIPAHFLAKSVDIIEDTVYYWRIREGKDRSITQKREDIHNFEDRLKALQRLDAFLNDHKVSQKIIEANQLKYLTVDFYNYLEHLKSADSLYIGRFQRLLSRELAKINPELFARIPARTALAYRLLLQNRMEDVLKIIRLDRRHGLSFKPYRRQGHWYKTFAVSDFTRKHPVCVDRSLDAVSRIHRVLWNGNGELEISGHAYIEGIDSGKKAHVRMSARLVNIDSGQETGLAVQLFKDRTVTRKWGVTRLKRINPLSRVYNYDWSGFKIRIDAGRALKIIKEGRWAVLLDVAVRNLEKTVRLGAPLRGSNRAGYRMINETAFHVKYNGSWQLAVDVCRPDVVIQRAAADKDRLIIGGRLNRNVSDLCLCFYDRNTGEQATIPLKIRELEANRFTLAIPGDRLRSTDFKETGWVIGYRLAGESIPKPADGQPDGKSVILHTRQRDIWIEHTNGRMSIFASEYRHPFLGDLKFADGSMILRLTLPCRCGREQDTAGKRRLLFETANNAAPPVAFDLDSGRLSRAGEENTVKLSCFDRNGNFRWYASGKWHVFIVETETEPSGRIRSRKIPVILSESLSKAPGVCFTYQKIRFRLISGRHRSLAFRTEIHRGFADRSPRRRKCIQWYLYPLMRLLPIKKNMIIFESFWGKAFNDNPKAIYDYMKRAYGDKYRYVWFMDNEYLPVSGCAKTVRKYSLYYFYCLARGKYFVANATFPDFYIKRHGQIEMQTLHGTFMKTMGLNETVTFNTKNKQNRLLRRAGRWDFLISPSPYMTSLSKRAYLFNHRVVECGFPRNDALYRKNTIKNVNAIKKKLHLPADKKIVMYAPTFRNTKTFDLRLDLAKLQKCLAPQYIFLLRLHYFVAGRIDTERYRGFVFDVSFYPEIQDLYLISDLLITDYSSVMFDYAHLKRPMLFFAYDLEDYRNNLRGIYLDYEETVPGPIVSTTEDIIREILELPGSARRYRQTYEAFLARFCTFGRGDSAKRAVECLLNPAVKLQPGEHYYRNLWKRRMHTIYPAVFRRVGRLPRTKTVIFESFFGQQFSDNPRAIYEYMKENHPEYRLVWNVKKGYEEIFKKENVPYVIKYSYRGLWQWARAEYWVTNSRWPLWLPKPKDTVYVQTWHGTPLKTIGADIKRMTMPGMTAERYRKEFSEETRRWDYCIAPNAYSSKIFKRAFELQGEMIQSGYPRNDWLYRKNDASEMMRIKEKLGIPRNQKVILYAPTWRDNEYSKIDHYTFDLKLDLQRMKEKFGGSAVLLMRMHYLIAEKMNLSGYEDFAKDVSFYEDIRELLLIADCLITDYSSVFFDYANLKRPIVFFAYDLDDYANKIRGFYFDLAKEAPGPIVRDMDHLPPAVSRALSHPPLNPYPEFYHKFCGWEDGYASERAVRAFLKDKKTGADGRFGPALQKR